MANSLSCVALFLVGAGLTGCDYFDPRLKIVNHSAAPIFVEAYPSLAPAYPSVNHTAYYREQIIPPDSTYVFMIPGKNAWLNMVRTNRNRRLNLCVFQVRDLDRTHSIDSLIRHQEYTRLSFSEPALDSMHWQVVYSAPAHRP
jgi:hypothetical protein